ncbi:S41 family peptidase [Geofilum rubicundum]|uniref:Carboxy-terminal processing protease n=1 Tax=Geofilum rubicundum JCM 15548 TaxID=1236989 RepID=A0A0E9M0A8_9BACT|nr:PDZ domain-containing protein [Geofilum rubicundum]GAO31267.1 carboxy-terminal processing protease [Geofilum rubicundum JCM 15548]
MPAQESGLKAGDRILKIDGISMEKVETPDVSEKLKGAAGTEVKVLVQRPGIDEELEITIERRVIQINPVPYYGMINENTGLIILNNFTQNASREVEKAYNDLKQNKNMSTWCSICVEIRAD